MTFMSTRPTLHRAVADGDLEEVFCLIRDGADANHLDDQGRPAAWFALGDSERVTEEELERRQAILRILRLHGASLDDAELAEHLFEQHRAIIKRLFGTELTSDDGAMAPSGDVGATWLCDVARTQDGVAAWLTEHPSVRVLGADADAAFEGLFARISEQFGDCEPNMEFVGTQPEDV